MDARVDFTGVRRRSINKAFKQVLVYLVRVVTFLAFSLCTKHREQNAPYYQSFYQCASHVQLLYHIGMLSKIFVMLNYAFEAPTLRLLKLDVEVRHHRSRMSELLVCSSK